MHWPDLKGSILTIAFYVSAKFPQGIQYLFTCGIFLFIVWTKITQSDLISIRCRTIISSLSLNTYLFFIKIYYFCVVQIIDLEYSPMFFF